MSDKTAKSKEKLIDSVEEIAEEAATLREEVVASAEDISARAREGVQELEDLIKAHPVQSTLVAFGLGFILSRFLSR